MSLLGIMKFVADHPVARDHKIATAVRIARWQISSRLTPGAVLFDWINGSKFIVRKGETGLTGNVYAGLHEFPDMAYVLHVLRQEDFFVDIGANVGSYTILAGAAVGASGYAFEPVPNTFRKLTDNIRINRAENRVKAINMGLAARAGVIKFTSGLDTVNHVLAQNEQSSDAIEVNVTTLDEAIEGFSPCLMKIDVEGFETPVLEGAQRTLGNRGLHSIIIELNGSGNRYNFDESKILDLLAAHDFMPHSYDPFTRRLIRLGEKNVSQGNTIFVRNLEFVQERLNSAAKFNVIGVDV